MPEHAVLSASGAHRWLNCPPSALLEHALPESTSEAADEGTAAHDMAARKLHALVTGTKLPPRKPSKYDSPEMERCTDDYAQFVAEAVAEAKKAGAEPVVLVERRVDYSRYVPEGFGTADCIIIGLGVMHVVDFKYGRGVMVEAENNPQMRLYALGAIAEFDMLYDINEVRMTIFQPRREHVSTEALTAAYLNGWAEFRLAPAAELAIKGQGNFACGEWCRFCKAGATCRARAEANLEIARHEFANPAKLARDEIADVLRRVDELVEWAGSVKRYALQMAMEGETWPGFKLVEGRSVRRVTDEAAFIAEAVHQGIAKEAYLTEKLRGIIEMEKNVGKTMFNEIFGGFVKKPQGAPALVPESDKRPPLNLTTAKSDFAKIEEEEYVD